MEQIRILTLWYANNMGAQLQALALCRFLNAQGDFNCRLLRYHPVNSERSWIYLSKSKYWKAILKNIILCFRIDLYLKKKKKNKLMKDFIKKYQLLSDEEYWNYEELHKTPPSADVFIAGSDQIWNFILRKDSSFFLDFIPNNTTTKRIAYAPSIADPWIEKDYADISRYLNNIDYLSVREKDDVKIVEKLSDKKVYHVCDPVFLLESAVWRKLAITPNYKGEYIFCYFLNPSNLALKLVKKIKKITQLPVIYLNLDLFRKLKADYTYEVAGPLEFLGFIINAKYVLTNSFHGSAFSIIFKKDFSVVHRKVSNSRLQSLFDIFGLNDRFLDNEKIDDLKLEDLKVDYSKCKIAGKTFIEASKKYLLNSINGSTISL